MALFERERPLTLSAAHSSNASSKQFRSLLHTANPVAYEIRFDYL